jgi:hypothetical protein
MQRAHRVSFKRVIKKLNVEIQKRRKTEPRDDDDDDYQPVQESKHGPENENEVRRLFGSLT